MVLRTQHDMINGDDPEMAKNNKHTHRLNDIIRTVGVSSNTPVFPWDNIFNEHLEDNIFDRWCHQWGDVSLYMMRRFTSWAVMNLPPQCFKRGKGWGANRDKPAAAGQRVDSVVPGTRAAATGKPAGTTGKPAESTKEERRRRDEKEGVSRRGEAKSSRV